MFTVLWSVRGVRYRAEFDELSYANRFARLVLGDLIEWSIWEGARRIEHSFGE